MSNMSKGFVNPYNFIAFPKQKAKAYDDTDKHTGYIEYTMETLTPLFIPNSSTETAFTESSDIADHKSYDFFSYTELDSARKYENEYHEPVIPGSEMRGMIRSVYETLTDSCMRVLNSDIHPVKRTLEQFKPGLIHRTRNGALELIKAKSYRIGNRAQEDELPDDLSLKNGCRNGSVVYIKAPKEGTVVKDYRDAVQKPYDVESYLLKWGMGVKKARYHVFVPDNNNRFSTIKKLTREEIEHSINELIDSYVTQPAVSDNNRNAYESYRKDFMDFLNGKGEGYFPVNYSKIDDKDGSITYISPAVYTKEISVNSIEKIAGEFVPCKEKDICPACDMFGYMGNSNETSRGSRIRFSDLHVTEKRADNKEYYMCSKVTIPALSESKLGNVEFYLKKPSKDALFWTYDYYVDTDGNIHIQQGELRGRKFYWHHGKVSINDIKAEATNLNKTVRPVKQGMKFKGRLYYEGISKKQLNQLIWILGNGKDGLGYKLGSAKPFGLGSVLCYIDNVVERNIDINNDKMSYSMDGYNDIDVSYEQAGFSLEVKKEFEKIASVKTFSDNVAIIYPKAKDNDSDKGFEWFVNNHVTKSGKKMARSRNDMKINETLPYILDDNYMLSFNEKTKNANNDRNNKHFSSYNGQRGNNYASRAKNNNRH